MDGGSVLCELMDVSDFPFAVGTSSAIITVNGSIDYEQETSYMFDVFCYLPESSEVNSSATVIVEVLNANDHSPELDRVDYRAVLLESSPKGVARGRCQGYRC